MQLNEGSVKEGGALALLLRLLRSDAFALLLSQWTSLELYASADASSLHEPRKKLE